MNNKINYCIIDLATLTKEHVIPFGADEILWFIHPQPEFPQKQLEQIAENLSKDFSEFQFFTGHPESELFFRREPHPNIFVQNTALLNEKRLILKKTQYYDKYDSTQI